jgi:hypothetical protein
MTERADIRISILSNNTLVVSTENLEETLPCLPTEIWYKIMVFSPNPVPLARSNKRLYQLFKHPVTLSQWYPLLTGGL